MGIAALVLGIISVVLGFFGVYGWLGAILGIVGIVLGALGKKNNAKCAAAGLVLSIIGTALSLILFIACVACVGGLAALA